ncbi:hypothetical protein M501DRAFT_940607 [Patellaria atrata CBS 101060]|uniref:RING-type domain-containing protein n=1 Tax=Patellaria atrata CBS 101060 TaxID=1346257 RepID=A0A9P4VNA1_9PEZI|nr:hypothetical protein M501DRAFT_940607 [Patellaria atrata CBS 101060]
MLSWRLKRKFATGPSKRTSSSSKADQEPITHINPLETEPDDPALDELNQSLLILTDIFPNVQPEVFREMLANFDRESRLQVITENILKYRTKWVKGRDGLQKEMPRYKYRDVARVETKNGPLPQEERFRNEGYKHAARTALYQEFKSLSHSTVRAVLAEYNYSYTNARPTLLALVSRSWKTSFTTFFTRRKPPSISDHPLILWSSTGSNPRPTLLWTENAELNKELYDTLIAPILAKEKNEQEASDRIFAESLNEVEAEDAGAMYDCECCFIPNAFESISVCDDHCHFICFRCIRNSVREALYGQGWARNIDSGRGTLRCVAPSSNDQGECRGCIASVMVQRALLSEVDGETSWRKLEERSVSENLVKAQIPVLKCPFCYYAEVDDITLSSQHIYRVWNKPRLWVAILLLLQLLNTSPVRTMFRLAVLCLFLLLSFNYFLSNPFNLLQPIESSLLRLAQKQRGLKFTCLSPTCGRKSCIKCHKSWVDIHVCYESELLSLRTTIELATSAAIKRTCPQCNLSFVKSAGCNKLTCVCGYMMCYVCRQQIGKDGYGHFCQHFRVQPGRACTECEKCDLYRTEDEDVLIKRAAEQAEREWREKNGTDKSVQWEKRVWELEGKSSTVRSVENMCQKLKTRTFWEEMIDLVVEYFTA